MSHVIQHLVMPNLAFGAPEDMYVRLHNDKVHALMSEGCLLFDAGGRASFDTFFNSVTVGAWKKHSAVADVQLHLRGKGRFIVRLGMHRIGHAHRWLAEQVVTLSPDQDFIVPVDNWVQLENGMLYFALEALESASLIAGHFATCTAPQRSVKLGIVITHFNRKQWVLPAIARIRDELLNDPLYRDRIELVVVDNSQNITAEEAQGITLIPNKNLGGSGGFTRGLLHLKDQKDFTHCLFMDDDASCEIESIRRAYNFFAFAVTAQLAIAGSMLRELEPYRLFEKGARFNGVCVPLKSGMDMRSIPDLLYAELIDEKPDYGGWWFYGFSIEDVKEFAFPFFVRGDDSRFSIMNNFHIVTLNGITTWGDDFALKAGPLPAYLDTRYHLMHSALILNKPLSYIVLFAFKTALSQIMSCNYASAKAVILGIKDFIRGPSVYTQDLDASGLRATIAKIGVSERLSPVDRSKYKVVYESSVEGCLARFVRRVTLNGIFLPSIFFRDKTVFQHKGFRANFREVFRYNYILYEYEPKFLGYVVKFDRVESIRLIVKLIAAVFPIVFGFDRIKKVYRSNIPYLTSEEFWRNVYSN